MNHEGLNDIVNIKISLFDPSILFFNIYKNV